MGVVTTDLPFMLYNPQTTKSYPFSPIIVVYMQSMTTRFGGDVYVRESTDSALTTKAYTDLVNDPSTQHNVSAIDHVVVVTWYMVPYLIAGDYVSIQLNKIPFFSCH